MRAQHYDVLVLGAGNAGLGAASVAREAGRSVAVVEARELGGTCPLRGCVPKKVLVAASEVLESAQRGEAMGIHSEGVRADWSRVIDRQREILAGTSEGIEGSLEQQGIALERGHARFVSADRVSVDGRELSADRIVIATGSTPRALSMPGAGLLASSDELLVLREPPASIVFVGAGVIAFELGHVFARLGTKVTLLEVGERPLGMLDEEAVGELVRASEALGMVIHTRVRVREIEAAQGGRAVTFEDATGQMQTITASLAAHGAGRVPHIAGLGLDEAGVEVARGAVVIGSPFQSASNLRVFVAGDALTGTPQLSPVATMEGRLVGRALLGEEVEAQAVIPSCVFSLPTLASVGMSEQAAQRAGIAVQVKRNDMRSWRSSRSYGEQTAWAKVLLGEDERIVGAHMVGHGAGELINIFALAMRHGLSAGALREQVWAYPTFGADIKYLV